jgi:hypothetical protein
MGFPYPDPAATLGLSAYMRFFEQAVEWDKLAYLFYPYFWSGQQSWIAKILTREEDGKFASFLSSGAARVIVPIRPGYEAAFERFLHTGITPSTDEMLDVGGPLWVAFVDQLRSLDGLEAAEVAVGEPWQIRLATDLVRARADGSIPKWSFAAGAWSEAPDPAF